MKRQNNNRQGGGGGGRGGGGGGRSNNAGNITGNNTGNNGGGAPAANNTGAGAGNDPQESLTLDSSQVAAGLANDGQDPPVAGQVASATSTNNFINFCLTRTDLPLTNGAQVKTGSCNAVPMGVIAAQTKAPACKFVNPPNMATIKAQKTFTIQMKIQNVNAQTNYYSAPQNTDGSGTIIGHSHVTIQQIDSLETTDVLDPTVFAFFKGFNDPAQNGILSADVTGGLPAGAYRMCSINSAANHQPVLVGVAQRGSVDDCVYFTATADGQAAGGEAAAGAGAAAAGGGAGGEGAANATAPPAANNNGTAGGAASQGGGQNQGVRGGQGGGGGSRSRQGGNRRGRLARGRGRGLAL
ncbi:BQ2448_3203 [Microbotryum intermedium]|uniref:BQ2448_3203 protein n=1 Tax=Microbotryum intermedium TaxID=269621 RepID=A0A238FEJ6_9BASI|nr:BQ2448_3203 [Microbotryum intermedium]